MVIGAASGGGGAPPLNPLLRPLAATAAPPSRALLLPAAPPKHALADTSAPNNHRPASHEHRDSKAIPLSLDSNRPLLTSSNIPNDHVKSHSSSSLPHQNALNDKLNKVANVKHDDDDFDIDSYYARLHAIPNVSLSTLDTQKPKVEESAFSEIDLNSPVAIEPDSTDDSSIRSQGLTSDLAQNFSQLPQVLPQVASTVLNSFSSILNLGRYPSKPIVEEYSQSFVPDIRTDNESYSQSGFQDEEHPAIPLFNRDEFSNDRCKTGGSNVENSSSVPSNFIPNPQSQELNQNAVEKPPSIGSGNLFRMNVKKKKTYAQVPGLTLGDVESSPTVHGMPPYNSFPQNPPNFNAQSMPIIPPPYPTPGVDEASKIPNMNTLPPAHQMTNMFHPNPSVVSNIEPFISIETTPRIFDPNLAQKDTSSLNFSSTSFTHVPDVLSNATPFSNVPSNSENIFNLNAPPSQDIVNTDVPLYLDSRSNVDYGQNIIQENLSSLIDEKNTAVESPFSHSDNTWQQRSENEGVQTKLLDPTSSFPKLSNLHDNSNISTFSTINTPIFSTNISENFQNVTHLNPTSSISQLSGNMPPVDFIPDNKNISNITPDVANVQNNNDHKGVIDVPTFFDPTKFANSEIGNANTQNLPTSQVPPVIPPPSQLIPNKTDNKFRMSTLNKRLKYYSGPIENSNANIPPSIPNTNAEDIQTHSSSGDQFEPNQVPFNENQSRLTPSNTGSGFGLNVFQNKMNLSKLQNVVTSFFNPSQNNDEKNYGEISNEFNQPQQYNYIPSFSESDSVQDMPSFFSPSTMQPVTSSLFPQGAETASMSSNIPSNQFIDTSINNDIKNDTDSFSNSFADSTPHFFNIKNDLPSNDAFSNHFAPPLVDHNQFSNDSIPTFYTTNVQQEQQCLIQNQAQNISVNENTMSSKFFTENSEKVDVQSLNIKLDQTDFNIRNKYKVEDYMIEPSDSLPSESDDHVAKPQFVHNEYLPNNENLTSNEGKEIVIDPFIVPTENYDTILHAQSEPILPSSYSSAFVPVKSNIDKEVAQNFELQSNYISDIPKENVFNLKNDVEYSVNQPFFFNQDSGDKITMLNPSQPIGILNDPFSMYRNVNSQQSSGLPCDSPDNLICEESTEKSKVILDNEDDTVKADNEIKQIFSNVNLEDLGKSENFFSTSQNTLRASIDQNDLNNFINDIFDSQKSSDALINEFSNSIATFVVNNDTVNLETATKSDENIQDVLNNDYDENNTIQNPEVCNIEESSTTILSSEINNPDELESKGNNFSHQINDNSGIFDLNNYDNKNGVLQNQVNRVEESSSSTFHFALDDNAVNFESVVKPEANVFIQPNIINNSNNYNESDITQYPFGRMEESFKSALHSVLDDNAINFQTAEKSEENVFTHQSVMLSEDKFSDLNNFNKNEKVQNVSGLVEELSDTIPSFVSNDPIKLESEVKPEEFNRETFFNDSNAVFDLNNQTIQNSSDRNYIEESSNSVPHFAINDNAVNFQSTEENMFINQKISDSNTVPFSFNNFNPQNEIQQPINVSSLSNKNYFDSFVSSVESFPESLKCSSTDERTKNVFMPEGSLNTISDSLSAFEVPSMTKIESNLNENKSVNYDPFQNVSNDAFIKNFDDSLKLNNVDGFNSDFVNSSTSSTFVESQNQNDKKDETVPLFNFFSMMKSDVPDFKL